MIYFYFNSKKIKNNMEGLYPQISSGPHKKCWCKNLGILKVMLKDKIARKAAEITKDPSWQFRVNLTKIIPL